MQPTLLLIDDDVMLRKSVKRALRHSDLKFLEAGDGQQALEILATHSVDLILLDLVIPIMDGYTFLERVKADEAAASIPVCVMTALSDDINRRRAVSLGADDFASKPVNNTELRVRVNSLLRISRYRQSLDEIQQVRRQQEVWSEAQMWINEEQHSSFSVDDLPNFYQRVLHHAMIMTRAGNAALIVFGDTGDVTEVITPESARQSFYQLECLAIEQRPLRALLAQDQPVRIKEPDPCPGCGVVRQTCPARNSLLIIPLHLSDSYLHGAILLADKAHSEAFSDQDESLLQLFVIQVAATLERQYLLTALRQGNEALQGEHQEQQILIKKLQEAHDQLLQSEKMASIGQLAAGVAHEINNPIGFVNSNVGTLRTYVEQLLMVLEVYEQAEPLLAGHDETLQRIHSVREQADIKYLKKDVLTLIQESHQGLTRVKQIVQDLKDFSHVDEAEWQMVDLHKSLDSTLNIVNNEIKYKAKVIKEYGDLPQTECLASQLNQVFMNLLVNAAQAIETQGVITLHTGTQDDWVWVEVGDTGSGIEPEKLRRIFDPFFTTKPVGTGTGLGLSLSYGIVDKHGGRIEVDSEPGKGTTFRVWLPVRQPGAKTKVEAVG